MRTDAGQRWKRSGGGEVGRAAGGIFSCAKIRGGPYRRDLSQGSTQHFRLRVLIDAGPFHFLAGVLSGSGSEPFAVIADPNADAVWTKLHDLGSVAALDDVAAGALRHPRELRPLRKRQHAVEVLANGRERFIPLAERERWCFRVEFDNLFHGVPPSFRS